MSIPGRITSYNVCYTKLLRPAYTHFRPAQPILVAHFFLAHAAALRRDHRRLAAARDEADALPLGSGAIAGTSYAIDVEALARDLGFTRVVANSIDASSRITSYNVCYTKLLRHRR